MKKESEAVGAQEEITDEMIGAGVRVLNETDPAFTCDREIVRRIFAAMIQVQLKE